MALGDATMLGMAHRFVVDISNNKYNLGSWSQVDGLDVKWDVAEYRAGDADNRLWYFPGNTRYSVVRLTRGASAEGEAVRSWLNSTSFGFEPQIGSIQLLDSAGNRVMSWELRHVMPVRWSIGGFEATASRVVTETLELAHRGFLDEELS